MWLRRSRMPRGRSVGNGDRRVHRPTCRRSIGRDRRANRSNGRTSGRNGGQSSRPSSRGGRGVGRTRIRRTVLRRRQRRGRRSRSASVLLRVRGSARRSWCRWPARRSGIGRLAGTRSVGSGCDRTTFLALDARRRGRRAPPPIVMVDGASAIGPVGASRLVETSAVPSVARCRLSALPIGHGVRRFGGRPSPGGPHHLLALVSGMARGDLLNERGWFRTGTDRPRRAR